MVRRIDDPADPTGTARERAIYERALVAPTRRVIREAKALVRKEGVPTLQATGKPDGAAPGINRITVEQYRAQLEVIMITQMTGFNSPSQEANRTNTDRFLRLGETFGSNEVGIAIAAAGPDVDPNIIIEFDIPTPPEIRKALIENTGEHITKVSDDLQAEIMRAVRESALNGLGVNGTTQAIDAATGFGPVRSRMIARTESLRAFNLAAEIRYQNHGIELMEWVAVFDNRNIKDPCRDLDGNQYPVRGNHPPMPLHPQCRCAWVPIVTSSRTSPKVPRQMLIGPPIVYPWEDHGSTTSRPKQPA